MDCSTGENGVQEISLLESLNGEWLKLPLAVMRDVGPAVQTLGGLLEVTKKETYTAVTKISTEAHLPVGTVRRHLRALDKAGWISNRGREHTRRGRPRRTATLAITKKTSGVIEPYGVLPTWACCGIRNAGKLPWSAKALLSVVMARLMSFKAAAEDEDNHVGDEVIGATENMGGDERFSFSLDWFEGQTGLHRESIVAAKHRLHGLGIVRWSGGAREDGGDRTDLLVPNWEFHVVVTPASQGHVYLSFDRGSESE
ncbi:MAG: hypothetical protein WCB27_18790 [Thermoguttaceae bacterium]